MFPVIIFAIFINSVLAVPDEGLVDYYEQLVNKETEKALRYKKPVDASAFKADDAIKIKDIGEYDFIIVGAGAAGSVVASRLSEIKEANILLLEAGSQESNFTDIPGMYFVIDSSEYNWGYTSVPQNSSCLGMVDQKCPYPRGKSLGGTTTINGLVCSRGNKKDFDRWEAEGNPGWSYKDVLPYYIKSENSKIDGDPGYHGKGGPMNVEYHAQYSPQFYGFLEANKELGRKVVDYNGREELGVSRAQMFKIHGSRLSTARAYLRPFMGVRNNLKILTGSYVTKILIKSKRAYGVQFSNMRGNYIARATKEVIISAGSIATPQILMLSGIGPEDELKKHKIKLIQNLEVGKNLQDHTTFYGINVRTNYTEPEKSVREYVKEYLQGRGPYAIPGSNQGVGFLQTHFANTEGYPDVEIMMIPSNRLNRNYQEYLRLTDETFSALSESFDNARSFIIYVILLQPKSIGTVTLNSNNPYDYPLIDPRFLSDPDGSDIATMYAGVQEVQRIVNTNAFKVFNATLTVPALPACKYFKIGTKDHWLCFIRQLSLNIYHPVGTCKMGPKAQQGAVVDHELKVHGIEGLRVSDGSVIPFSLAAHPTASIIMVGERTADFIKKEYHFI